MSDNIWLHDRVLHGLACAAVHSGLRTILLLNATPEQVVWYSDVLAQMLIKVTGHEKLARATLSSSIGEDALWGVPFLPMATGEPYFSWNGYISLGYRKGIPQLITLPNLTRLSVACERSAVVGTDAAVIHLERHSQHSHWQPWIWWIAGCKENEIGQVSRHLLDRFLLRIPLSDVFIIDKEEMTHRIQHLQDKIQTQNQNGLATQILTDKMVDNLMNASKNMPKLTDRALEQVVKYIPANENYSVRRDIGLARLAEAVAMLATSPYVTHVDVDSAANNIMGFASLDIEESGTVDSKPDIPAPNIKPVAPELNPDNRPTQRLNKASEQLTTPQSDQAIVETRELRTSPRLPLGENNPYPEDHTPSEREFAPLQLSIQQPMRSRAFRGASVGVEPATDLHDLALVSTLFEAIKFQPIMRQRFPNTLSEGLILQPNNLRRYRRLPAPEIMLVLLLDYTAFHDDAWQEELAAHLMWAYTSRARIALIRVGAHDTENELRADCFLGRSLLDPRILAKLEAKAGKATPLAHGLELARQTLRHVLQHGRATVAYARLVIMTDGRGNVPLEASQSGRLKLPVNREGIDDALQVAAELSVLERTEIVCVDLAPALYGELVNMLAQSLGVTVCPLLTKKDD